MLKAIFLWIYCMDFREVLLLLAAFTGLYYLAMAKLSRRRLWKPAVILLLLIWAASAAAQTVFQRTPDVFRQPVWEPFQSYADGLKEGGRIELLRSNFMNTVFFYPAGVLLVSLLPEKWPFPVRLLIVLILFTGLSLAIELAQYHYHLGLAQTDDVIHNALGAFIGAAVFLSVPKAIRAVRAQ